MSAIRRLTSFAHFWHISNWLFTFFKKHIRCRKQISIHIICICYLPSIKQSLFLRVLNTTKSNNDTMNMRFLRRLTIPSKRSICKINMDRELLEQRLPQNRNLLALRNGISRNKSRFDCWIVHYFCCFVIPRSNIIYVLPNSIHYNF